MTNQSGALTIAAPVEETTAWVAAPCRHPVGTLLAEHSPASEDGVAGLCTRHLTACTHHLPLYWRLPAAYSLRLFTGRPV